MLYLVYGNDNLKKKEVREKIKASFEKKNQNLQVLVFNDLNFNQYEFLNFAGGSNLFGKSSLVILDGILETENLDFILSRLEELKDSSNVFVFTEGLLLKDIVKNFEKVKADIEEFKTKLIKAEKNVFAITFPFENRNKKETWVTYNNLMDGGVAPENLSGIIFWKIKTMISESKNRKYSQEELKKMSSRIVSLYHDAHRGQADFQTGLEKFILESV